MKAAIGKLDLVESNLRRVKAEMNENRKTYSLDIALSGLGSSSEERDDLTNRSLSLNSHQSA